MSWRRSAHPPGLFRGVGPAVTPEAEGQRVDLYLAHAYPFRSRRAWQAACAGDELLINGAPVRASRRLHAGDRITVFHPPAAEPEVDVAVGWLGLQDGILAVDKPANLPMHESGLYWRKTLHALVAAKHGPDWHAVHRLDRETSGVVLFAACPDLRRRLSQAFETHLVQKTYLAIVQGVAGWDEIEVDAAIGPDPSSHFPRGCVRADGASARTRFRVVERRRDATLLEALPRTGRNNQIRVHAAHLGLPLAGDKQYQPDGRAFRAYQRYGDGVEARALAGHRRHCLHAASIALRHPITAGLVRFDAPMPEDLRRFWAGLAPCGVREAQNSVAPTVAAQRSIGPAPEPAAGASHLR